MLNIIEALMYLRAKLLQSGIDSHPTVKRCQMLQNRKHVVYLTRNKFHLKLRPIMTLRQT